MRFLGAVICLMMLNVASFAQKETIDKVVATVGGELILLSEVEEQYALLESRNQDKLPEDARCTIMDQLLATKLLINQAKLDSIVVTDDEVEAQLDARISRILDYMGGDVGQFEDYYGQSISEVKSQFREDLKNQLLSERMRSQIMSEVTVTPSEVKSFYAAIPKDSLPYFSSEVEVGEIVYKPTISSAEKERAINLLNKLRDSLVNHGADFAALAKEYSMDGTRNTGGDLGWAQRGKYVQEFEAEAYKLDKNEISPVTQTEFGFHLIQMQERRGNSIRVRHILIRPEILDSDLERAYDYLDSIRSVIIRDSIDFSRAVKRYSNENFQSYNNDGRMVNPVTGNTFYEIGDLDPDIYFTIDTMQVGRISKPFEFRGPDGDTYYRIVQLQSRSEPHKADLSLDYSRIQKATIDAKNNEFINEWVNNKVNATYIDVDTQFHGCPILQKWIRDSKTTADPSRP